MIPPTSTKEPALHCLAVPGCGVYADEMAEGLDIHLDFTTGGDEEWEETSALSPVYGGDAVKSSYSLKDNEQSRMQTTGPRRISTVADCRLRIGPDHPSLCLRPNPRHRHRPLPVGRPKDTQKQAAKQR